MDRNEWEKREQSKRERAEIARRVRGFGPGEKRPRRADGTMMSDGEILAQEGKANAKAS